MSNVANLWRRLTGRATAVQVEPVEDNGAEMSRKAPLDHRQTIAENERNYRTECLDR